MQLYCNYKRDFFQEIGKTIKELRTAKGLELSEMREITGYTSRKMSDIEAGEDSRLLALRLDELFRIFGYFDKKIRFVIEDLTLEDRVGTMLRDISSEDLIKLVALRSEELNVAEGGKGE